MKMILINYLIIVISSAFWIILCNDKKRYYVTLLLHFSRKNSWKLYVISINQTNYQLSILQIFFFFNIPGDILFPVDKLHRVKTTTKSITRLYGKIIVIIIIMIFFFNIFKIVIPATNKIWTKCGNITMTNM